MKTLRNINVMAWKYGFSVLCMAVLLPASLAPAAQEQAGSEPETYSAMFVGALSGKTTSITINIEGYSTDQEIQDLAGTLKAKGPDSLLEAVDKMKEKGRIAFPGSTGTVFQVARQHPQEGGRRIVLFANRPMSFAELQGQTRSTDYPFGLVILNLNAKDEGEGLLYGACKVRFSDDNEIEVEHYGQAPARLLSVRRMK